MRKLLAFQFVALFHGAVKRSAWDCTTAYPVLRKEAEVAVDPHPAERFATPEMMRPIRIAQLDKQFSPVWAGRER